MNKIIKKIEQQQIKKHMLSLRSGDLIEVQIWVIEGNKRRLQLFEGIVIAIKNRGFNSAFTVRKISYGEGVERVFQTYSPVINDIIIKRHSNVHQAKLYYLRNRTGKAARIKERTK